MPETKAETLFSLKDIQPLVQQHATTLMDADTEVDMDEVVDSISATTTNPKLRSLFAQCLAKEVRASTYSGSFDAAMNDSVVDDLKSIGKLDEKAAVVALLRFLKNRIALGELNFEKNTDLDKYIKWAFDTARASKETFDKHGINIRRELETYRSFLREPRTVELAQQWYQEADAAFVVAGLAPPKSDSIA